MTEYWEAIAEYDDGTRIEKRFPYHEGGNYEQENERQYQLEEWLLQAHDGCTFYTINYVQE